LLGTAVDYVIRNTNVPVLVVKQRPHVDYRILLIPTDFSDRSTAALLSAAQLFPDAAIHLVHAHSVPLERRLDTPPNRTEVERQAQEKFEGYLNSPAFPPELRTRVNQRLGYGDKHLVIGKAIEDVRAEFVVLASRGRSALGQAIIGNTIQGLLSSIAQDTLVVRP
jgi:nucleotide-binding universal stress UspA family protein